MNYNRGSPLTSPDGGTTKDLVPGQLGDVSLDVRELLEANDLPSKLLGENV